MIGGTFPRFYVIQRALAAALQPENSGSCQQYNSVAFVAHNLLVDQDNAGLIVR